MRNWSKAITPLAGLRRVARPLLRFRVVGIAMAMAIMIVTVRADQWALPTVRRYYYSRNRQYRIEITPRAIDSQLQYFADRVEGREPAGTGGRRNEAPPRATLAARRFPRYRNVSSFQLTNAVAPVDVVVSDKGDYVVTFDDWHEMGFGESVVVIYRSDGHLVRRFSLTDLFVGSDIDHFSRSVSSIVWRQAAWIDHTTEQVVLVVSSKSTLPSKWARTREVRLDLATGDRAEPRQRLWPVLTGVVTVQAADAVRFGTPPDPEVCRDQSATFATPGIAAVASRQLLDEAVDRTMPVFPPVLITARVLEASVAVELLVRGDGTVQCARTLAGTPFLRHEVIDAVRHWMFAPIESRSTWRAGRLHFRFVAEWR